MGRRCLSGSLEWNGLVIGLKQWNKAVTQGGRSVQHCELPCVPEHTGTLQHHWQTCWLSSNVAIAGERAALLCSVISEALRGGIVSGKCQPFVFSSAGVHCSWVTGLIDIVLIRVLSKGCPAFMRWFSHMDGHREFRLSQHPHSFSIALVTLQTMTNFTVKPLK